MAAGWLRAKGRARGGDSVPERRRRTALAVLLLATVASGATLGSRVFAGVDVPLAAETAPSSDPSARPELDVAGLVAEPSTRPAEEDALVRTSAAPVFADAQPDSALDVWIRDLAQDRVRWNATTAVGALLRAGAEARPKLEAVLASTDEQQRHLAAYVLRRRDDSSHPQLFAVSVEAMGKVWLTGYHETLIHRPAVDAFRWFVGRGAEPAAALRRGLDSADAQRQLLCAYLLARSGAEAPNALVARLLVDHLGDNRIQGDALLAANGLWHLGQRAIADVHYARRWADEQGTSLLDLIELDLQDDATGRAVGYPERKARYQRLGLRSVTETYVDPVRDFDPLRSAVPHF